MKNIESCIIKDNNNFFIDLQKWETFSDIPIEVGDIFSFNIDNKKHSVKVININNYEALLTFIT
jgi:hypothetical protein